MTMTMTEEKIYTVDELAALLGLNRVTVIREMKRGKLKHFRAGREYRVRHKALEEYMRDRPAPEDKEEGGL